jgi:hypothetical protein
MGDFDPIEEVKKLREEYRKLEERLNYLKDNVGHSAAGRYVSLALTETESSRHWLGEALGAFGLENQNKF